MWQTTTEVSLHLQGLHRKYFCIFGQKHFITVVLGVGTLLVVTLNTELGYDKRCQDPVLGVGRCNHIDNNVLYIVPKRADVELNFAKLYSLSPELDLV